jgi:outer membrane receptor protein involved in Fe transport
LTWRALGFVVWAVPSIALAQDPARPGQDAAAQDQPPVTTELNVTVIGSTPLPDVGLPIEQVPSPVQTLSATDIQNSGALGLADFLNRRLNGVFLNENQGNPFQPDLNYRGYTASPLLGTPQGLSVYLDGVRLNQPFGDVVSWDLIPSIAVSTGVMMPGSNPLFGLNTLGGALSIQTKDGRTSPGTSVQATYGSDVRRAVEFEHGGSRFASSAGPGTSWYLAGSLFAEDGWRDDSPSDVRQLFGKVGWVRPSSALTVAAGYADNSLNGNGLQEAGFLERDYDSVYTKPDTTENRSALLNLTSRRDFSNGVQMSGNAYYRYIRTNTLNGDMNEASLDQAIYQPTPAERAALAAAGYTGVPASGATAENTPFPFWRCLGNVLLEDEPFEQCNGLINRTHSTQHNGGASAQLTWSRLGQRRHQVTTGGAYDGSEVDFAQSSELGYLNPDRSVTGTGAFSDGVTGGTVGGEPYDTRVDLHSVTHTWSLYATDTFQLAPTWHLTVSGRFNRTTVANRDRIEPGGGPASLDGDHAFSRFNPAAGVTFVPSSQLNAYFGYSEGSRAPTSIELGCANPEQPCRLPNAMAGDPPLDQVVTRTLEAGVRGRRGRLRWNAGAFFADNRDDLLFVTSDQTGFGYFRNFGKTRRQGVEAAATGQFDRVTVGAAYTFLDATYRSEEVVNGEGNSSNDADAAGLEGTIQIVPGDQIPLVPRHAFKIFADLQILPKFAVNIDLVSTSGVYARGNENNGHQAEEPYYLGPGMTSAYAVVNLGARYDLTSKIQAVAQVNNVFDTRYETAAQLGPNGFTEAGTFMARPFPPVGGEFPLQHATFFAPGAPRRVWAGIRLKL